MRSPDLQESGLLFALVYGFSHWLPLSDVRMSNCTESDSGPGETAKGMIE